MPNRDRTGDQCFHIHPALRQRVWIIDIGHATRHTGAKIGPDSAQNHRNPAGHIFAPIAAAAFNHNLGT